MRKDIEPVNVFEAAYEPVEGFDQGIKACLLNTDESDGSVTVAVKMEPGFEGPEHTHPGFCEHLVINGEVTFDGMGTFKKGAYFTFPANVEHGPFRPDPEGCILVEILTGGGLFD